MAANTALIVTGLNFDTIRANLRNYIASKPDFADFDFTDSAIGSLLDLLAYNTYYNAFYVNMAASEAFLDSAQFYDSVVSRAKMLGYVPTSARGATANVQISFTTAVATPSAPTLTIPQNTRFSSTINGVSYYFVTPKSYTIAANSTNRFQSYIEITEGYPLTHRYAFTTTNTAFVLPNKNIDTRSLSVVVTSGANNDTYIEATDVLTVNSSSQVFYVEGDRDNKYKISFGDNVLGKRPNYNSTIAISYRACNATKGNGANNFTASGTIAGESNFTIRVMERATGGADQESIESIKFNAPKSYETQNRAVTVEDYKRIILRLNPDLEACNTWGGEENDPPVYGKVFATVKPYEGTLISSARKTQIKADLQRYKVASQTVEFVDPTFLYIKPTVTVEYDSRRTTLTASQLAAAVAARIITFETNNFNRFDSKFWLSRFLNYLDLTNESIVGTSATVDLQKRFVPSTTAINNYSFNFNTKLDRFGVAEVSTQPLGWLTSSSFTYAGFTSYLEDTGFGVIRIYYRSPSTNDRIYTNLTAGTVDYDTGEVELINFLPTAYSGDEIKLNVRSKSPNIEAIRNQLLFFADASVIVKEVNDANAGSVLTTIATQGQSTTLNETGLVITSY